MDHSNVISGATKGSSSVAHENASLFFARKNICLLLVGHERTSLMSLKQEVEQQFYKGNCLNIYIFVNTFL